MKLSVIIPVYNAAEFIQKSYRSITEQQIENFEIIYVDNNSIDNSVKLIKQIVSEDIRVKLFHQPKQGAAPARNLGIKKAIGDYIYVFDVDDEIYPGALLKMIGVLDENQNIDAVFGKMVKSYTGILETEKPKDETDALILKETPFWGIHWFTSLRNVVGPPAFLYRKEVFIKIGFYNENLKNDEDTALDIKLGMTCNVAFLDTYVYLYFKHDNSTIQKTKKNENMIFHTWNRLVREHLKFYFLHDVPFEYKKILFRQLFANMAKVLFWTDGLEERQMKLRDLQEEISPLLIPKFIKYYLIVLVYLPFEIILKFYVYYLSPWYVDKSLKTNFLLKKD